MARDKQARAARRAAERAELERRRIEAKANRTWADDARETLNDAEFSGPLPDMSQVDDQTLALVERSMRVKRTARHLRAIDLIALVAALGGGSR